MKLTVLFLFLVIIVATNAIIESVKKMFNDEELTDALKKHYMNFVWANITYGAIR